MIRIFPIAAPTRTTNSFGEDRGGRAHQGNDLFAAEGSPLVAVDSGQLRSGIDPLGGNIVNLYADDGTRYYYAHLLAFADETRNPVSPAQGGLPPPPRRVNAGDVVGFVGRTGNAGNTPPHLHFELHPGNGVAVDPFSALERATRIDVTRPSPVLAVTRPPIHPGIALLGAGLLAATVWAVMNPTEAARLSDRLLRF